MALRGIDQPKYTRHRSPTGLGGNAHTTSIDDTAVQLRKARTGSDRLEISGCKRYRSVSTVVIKPFHLKLPINLGEAPISDRRVEASTGTNAPKKTTPTGRGVALVMRRKGVLVGTTSIVLTNHEEFCEDNSDWTPVVFIVMFLSDIFVLPVGTTGSPLPSKNESMVGAIARTDKERKIRVINYKKKLNIK